MNEHATRSALHVCTRVARWAQLERGRLAFKVAARRALVPSGVDRGAQGIQRRYNQLPPSGW